MRSPTERERSILLVHALGLDRRAAQLVVRPNLLKQAKTEGFFQQRELRKTDTAHEVCVEMAAQINVQKIGSPAYMPSVDGYSRCGTNEPPPRSSSASNRCRSGDAGIAGHNPTRIPTSKADLTCMLHPYWNTRDAVAVENGLIPHGCRLVIPSSMRRRVLQELHDRHQGIERTNARARQTVYWPSINNDIMNTVRSCADYPSPEMPGNRVQSIGLPADLFMSRILYAWLW